VLIENRHFTHPWELKCGPNRDHRYHHPSHLLLRCLVLAANQLSLEVVLAYGVPWAWVASPLHAHFLPATSNILLSMIPLLPRIPPSSSSIPPLLLPWQPSEPLY
jgi:hypothetical protein